MTLHELPALFMRGGTSKALVFDVRDLPAERSAWDDIFLSAMGSPDSYGRQLDGMGGGISSLSKICVLGPPSRHDADIDFTFAQVSVSQAKVDYAGNCGNMISAMGPAALEFGYIDMGALKEARIRIHNTNTKKIIVSQFPLIDGRLDPYGTLAIDGVAGQAAPIRLDFLDPGGAKTGTLLPTGKAIDTLILSDGRRFDASLIDAANPCVFVQANDLGKTGVEHPDDLLADAECLQSMEMLRQAGSVLMGLAPDLATAANLPSIPKVAMVAPPRDVTSISGVSYAAEGISLIVRMISMEQPHRAVPITGAICLAVACRVPGSIPHKYCGPSQGPLTLSHPSGAILVDADVRITGQQARVVSGTVFRTARKLFSGQVHYRLPTN